MSGKPRCAEQWDSRPTTSDHIWNADIHGCPSGNCLKCGEPIWEYNKRWTVATAMANLSFGGNLKPSAFDKASAELSEALALIDRLICSAAWADTPEVAEAQAFLDRHSKGESK